MDDFKKFCRVILVIALILAVAALIYLIFELVRRIRENKILKENRKDRDFIYKLLKNDFPFFRIYGARVFNKEIASGAQLLPIDACVINKGGIALITVIRRGGKIDDPYRGDWTVEKKGEIIPFPNPIEKMAPTVSFTQKLFADAGISNVPIEHLVVLTGRKVLFKNEMDRVLCAEELYDYIRDMNGEKILTGSEIADCAEFLEEHTSPYVPKKMTE